MSFQNMQKIEDHRQLEALARRIRIHVLRMVHRAKSSHAGSNLSIAEILAVLYGSTLRIDPSNPRWKDRDRFILSKGHAAAALYAVLAERKFFPEEWLERFYCDGAPLAGHVTHIGVPGVEVSSGALGHGLSIACGMALAAKRDGAAHRIFALLSDGECDEGSIWEAVLFAPHHALDNLCAVIDFNKIQSLGSVREVLNLEPLADKWESFGWEVLEVDGHDISQLQCALAVLPVKRGHPTCIVAHTVKGHGISFMEHKLLWHYRSPDDDELARAMRELGES